MNLKQIKNLPGARKTAMPEFVPPQLATLVEKPPPGDEWFHELKLDGYRLLGHLNNGQVRFWTRNQNDWTAKFPALSKALKALKLKSAILDGEVVALDPSGRASFQRLQQSINKGAGSGLLYHVFDLIYIDGYSLVKTPLRDRKRVLADLLEPLGDKCLLRYSDHIEGNGAEFFKEACKYGLEGIVSKRGDSVYEFTRTRNWVKIKCLRRQEFVIAGYTLSDKGIPFSSLILGVYDRGQLIYAGRAGTGFSNALRVELKKTLDKLVRKDRPFAVIPKDPGLRRAVWVEPKLVGEVAFSEWTDENIIRHPSFQGLRQDKKPHEVIREEPS
ncbi:MAG TPA: non-homologous end-joining DNA ligase [Pyrinomonadaceae bacterium]|nr:non-homologous end-joining DNA ligase [Pyrinomonadaceae bacterium]